MKKTKKKKKEKKINRIKTSINKIINGIEISFICYYGVERNYNNRMYLINILKSYIKRKYEKILKSVDCENLEKILKCFEKKYLEKIEKEISYIIYDECLEIKELLFAKRFLGKENYLYQLLEHELIERY